MNRFQNTTFNSLCVKSLNQWVRIGNIDARLSVFRALGKPKSHPEFPLDDEPHTTIDQLVEDMSYHVVQFLLQVAKGRSPNPSNKYGYYPYTKPAGEDTGAFQKVPTSWFASTLADVYPFVKHAEDKWPSLLKKFTPPMTGLWPVQTLKRHMNFQEALHLNRCSLFKLYEKEGGDYHGSAVVTQPADSGEGTESSSDDDDDDDEF